MAWAWMSQSKGMRVGALALSLLTVEGRGPTRAGLMISPCGVGAEELNSWLTSSNTSQAQIQDFEMAQPSIFPMDDLL